MEFTSDLLWPRPCYGGALFNAVYTLGIFLLAWRCGGGGGIWRMAYHHGGGGGGDITWLTVILFYWRIIADIWPHDAGPTLLTRRIIVVTRRPRYLTTRIVTASCPMLIDSFVGAARPVLLTSHLTSYRPRWPIQAIISDIVSTRRYTDVLRPHPGLSAFDWYCTGPRYITVWLSLMRLFIIWPGTPGDPTFIVENCSWLSPCWLAFTLSPL